MSLTNLTDKVYFDLIITDTNNQNVGPKPIFYNEARSIPFLYKPSLYTLSVVRWTVSDATTIPIWRCAIKPNSPSPVDSIYSITMTYGGQTFQAYLQYESQNKAVSTPVPPSLTQNGLQSNVNSFYDVYNYQYVIYLFNKLLKTVFDGLNNLIALPTTNAPFFSFDTSSRITIFNADINGFTPIVGDYIQVYFNTATTNLFYSFPYLLKNIVSPLGLNYELQINVFGDASVISLPLVPIVGVVPYTAYQVFQEYSTTSAWSPVLSICITSNTLPIAPNQISSVVYIGDNIQNPSGNNAQSNQLLTDFSSDTGDYRGYIYYVPTAEYRRLTLLASSDNLSNLSLGFYWRDRLGTLNPLLLPSGGSATVKLLFELIK